MSTGQSQKSEEVKEKVKEKVKVEENEYRLSDAEGDRIEIIMLPDNNTTRKTIGVPMQSIGTRVNYLGQQ